MVVIVIIIIIIVNIIIESDWINGKKSIHI